MAKTVENKCPHSGCSAKLTGTVKDDMVRGINYSGNFSDLGPLVRFRDEQEATMPPDQFKRLKITHKIDGTKSDHTVR